MELDFTPKFSRKISESDGGAYYSWSSSEFPLLRECKVGAGKLVLQPRGFALPHYADSSKVAYVLQGSDGLVGMVFPNTAKVVVLKLTKGNVIPVPMGAVSWWFNDGDSELHIVFLGETSKAYVPGEFTYFVFTGALGILGGLSPEFVSRVYDMSKDDANKLAKSQTGVLIVRLQEGKTMQQPEEYSTKKLVFDIDAALPDICVKNGGIVTTLTEAKFPFIGQVELSSNLVKLDAKAMCSPMYTADSEAQVIYVVKGSGKIQIVGINGKRVLDMEVKPGQLLVVQRFFVVAKLESGNGLECFSVITDEQPVLEVLAGEASSVWEALSPSVLEASLNVSAEFAELFKSKARETGILLPPKN